jgi:hypothetical protein
MPSLTGIVAQAYPSTPTTVTAIPTKAGIFVPRKGKCQMSDKKFYALYANEYNIGDPIERFLAPYSSMARAKKAVETEIEDNPLREKYGEWITDGWKGDDETYATITYEASNAFASAGKYRQWTIRIKYLIDD